MEYSFSRNDIGQPVAEMNMEAEAFAHWLNIEMSGANFVDLAKIETAVDQLLTAHLWQFEFAGREFHLELNRQQASVSANALLQQNDEYVQQDEEDFEDQDEYLDEQGLGDTSIGFVASCGLEDFQQLIKAWIRFLSTQT